MGSFLCGLVSFFLLLSLFVLLLCFLLFFLLLPLLVLLLRFLLLFFSSSSPYSPLVFPLFFFFILPLLILLLVFSFVLSFFGVSFLYFSFVPCVLSSPCLPPSFPRRFLYASSRFPSSLHSISIFPSSLLSLYSSSLLLCFLSLSIFP